MSVYDPDAHAALLCDWSLRIRAGDAVLVEVPEAALPLGRALHRAILQRGAWPTLRVEIEGLARDVIEHAGDAQLDAPSPIALAELAAATKLVRIHAPGPVEPLAGADPARVAQLARGRSALRRISMDTPWCLSIHPTAALAERAGMTEDDYAAFVHRALMLDRPDPAGAWAELSAVQAALIERLARASVIRIQAEGTDLSLEVGGRTWQNSDGRRNLPSGEVFTGPHEQSANGVVQFSVPSYRAGGVVRGARLVFADGKVVEATAEEGQDVLEAELATDDGARYLGELGIGTSPGIDRATGSTLLDEKITGTVHLAVGQSYPETGGTNTSAVHWDLIADLRHGGLLTADGETIVEDGRLV
ncbi:MAG: aminopeptidase [Solirubrobacteraceae bacterium]|nr:aminopeptidase [Solirubrobacteraceae bacterium]